MKKPSSLRQYLIDCVPDFKKNPEMLQVFLNEGTVTARLQGALHFEYSYDLELIITDMGMHPDNLMVPLLAWVKVHQPDIQPELLKFQAEILDKDKVDLSLVMPLTERVLVTENEDGNYTTDHPDEPLPEYNLPEPAKFQALFARLELMTPGYVDE